LYTYKTAWFIALASELSTPLSKLILKALRQK